MKKITFFTIAMLMFNFVNAQTNVVKVNPLGLAFGALNFTYEKAISDKAAVELSVAYTSVKATVGSDADAKVTGFGLGAGYKAYFSKSVAAPRGWYVEPNLGYSKASSGAGSAEGSISLFNAGAYGGYQWIFGGNDTGFALDLGLGFNYITGNTSGDISGVTLSGIVPAAKLAIGYGF